jgi:probable F420-dependent oxidoreductase
VDVTTFSLQASPSDGKSWRRLAQQCEAAGFDALLAADHPGSAASPFVALAAAGALTSTLGLGSYVSNAAVRDPILLAADVATLDVLSGGRARLGLGAGHTPAELLAVGRERPGVASRVRRCLAVAKAVRDLLDGEEVTLDSDELVVHAAQLTEPRPVQKRIPLTIGAANSELLYWAGAHADIVGLTGFGRTLAGGHAHQVRWHTHEIEAQLAHIAAGAAHREEPPQVEALVQKVCVTNNAEEAAKDTAQRLGLTVAQLLATPFVLIGTEDEIVSALAEHRKRWGITRYVVREAALDPLTPIVMRLTSGA